MIRGNKRNRTSVPTKRFDVSASIHNRFDIEVIDSVSGEVKQKAFAENVVCDKVYGYICSNKSSYGWNYNISCGDGTGTPSASDTALFNKVCAATSTLYSRNWNPKTNVYTVTKKAVFDENVAVGKNLTEVGIFGSDGTTLCTHAMLQDMNGNPVSILKTDTDIINVYATVFCHFTVPNDSIRVFCVPQHRFYYWNGGYRETEEAVNLINHVAGLATLKNNEYYGSLIPGYGYVPGTTKYTMTGVFDYASRTITYSTRLGATDANIGGIKTLFFGYECAPDIAFEIGPANGWYEKTAIVGESIGTGDGVTVDFSTEFPYVRNATVYVDGIAVEASVEHGYHMQSIGNYMRLIEQPAYGWNRDSYQYGVLCHDGTTMRVNTAYFTDRRPVFENVLYETVGIKSIYSYKLVIEVSNDNETWITIAKGVDGWATTTIPEEYQNYRYWRIDSAELTSRSYSTGFEATFTANAPLPSSSNIHLAEAPAEGAVITANYDTISIGKDANHVFDISIVFSFSEYVET